MHVLDRQHRPARPGRALAAAALCAMAAALCGCRPSRDGGAPVIESGDVAVEIGAGGFWEPGCPNLLRIEAQNRGGDFDGEVLVRGGLGHPLDYQLDPVTYRVRAGIPSGSSTEILVPVRPAQWNLVALELRQSGFRKRLPPVALPSDAARCRIVAVGGGRTDFGPLKDWLTAGLLRPLARAELERSRRDHGMTFGPDGSAEVRKATDVEAELARLEPDLLGFQTLDAAALPRHPAAYGGVQLAILYGASLASASPESIAALRGWVESGGALVAFAGPEWAAGAPEALHELLGVVPGEENDSAPAAVLEAAGLPPSASFSRRLLAGAGTRSIGGGFAFERRLGAGRAITFAFQPSGSRFPGPEAAPRLYDVLADAVLAAAGFYGPTPARLWQLEQMLPSYLFRMSDIRVPPAGAVALGFLVYLAIGFLAPAYLFKRLGRREWTFAWIAAAALLAVLGIYRFGLLSARQHLELDEVSVLRVHADGRGAEATSFLGVVSPVLGSVPIVGSGASDAGAAALPGPMFGRAYGDYLEFGRPIAVPALDLAVDRGARVALDEVFVFPNAMRHLRCDYRRSLDGLVEIDVETLQDGDALRVTLQNRSGVSADVEVVDGASVHELGGVAHGSALTIDATTTLPAAAGVSPGLGWEQLSGAGGLKALFRPVLLFPDWRVPESPEAYYGAMPPERRPGDDESLRAQSRTRLSSAGSGAGAALLFIYLDLPVFPAADGFEIRKGKTVLCMELPPGVLPRR
jgi:hypothetical protein